MKKIIDYSKLDKSKFLSGRPFPNIVIDNLFDPNFMKSVSQDFPEKEDVSWWEYDNIFEKKLAFNDFHKMPQSVQKYFLIINSLEFVRSLEELTGIKNLIADPSLYGGGLHKIERGGKLDIHSDFKYHKLTGWKRKLNVITYLNEDWEYSYKGCCEFWDANMDKCVTKILPMFNRTIIFTVDNGEFHGHPDPLNCPEERSRRSLASYYYAVEENKEYQDETISTSYKKRPSDKYDPEVEKLREQRRKGRLKDIKTK